MLKTIKKLSAIALAAASMAAVMPAQASTVAIADMTINSLGLIDTHGQAIDASVLDIRTESRTGNASANFNGVGTASNDSSNSVGAPVNVIAQCAGNCAGASSLYGGVMDNNFTAHPTSPGTVNYALGDMNISGSSLGGDVKGLTRADAMTSGPTNKGSANATIQNSGSIVGSFGVVNTFTGAVAVSADFWLQAFVDSVSPTKGQATASFSWSITITSENDPLFVLTLAPGQLNRGFTSTSLGGNKQDNNINFQQASAFVTFIGGDIYDFTINQSSNANVNETPEPGSLAVVSLGLLALGLSRRRARKS